MTTPDFMEAARAWLTERSIATRGRVADLAEKFASVFEDGTSDGSQASVNMITSMSTRIEELEARLGSAEDEISSGRKLRGDLDAYVDSLEFRVSELEGELADTQQRRDALARELERVRADALADANGRANTPPDPCLKTPECPGGHVNTCKPTEREHEPTMDV
jgi:chromosome segregation ATPase